MSDVVNFDVVGSTCGNTNGQITAHAIGGSPLFSFEWLSATNTPIGQTDSLATGLGAGLYKVVITDANMCTDTFIQALQEYILDRARADHALGIDDSTLAAVTGKAAWLDARKICLAARLHANSFDL